MSNATLSIITIAIIATPLILGITIHEAAHAYAAYKCGDKTAQQLGRVSLNPFKHIDLIGTVIVPLMLVLTTGFIFGWAKPVPVNMYNLKNPRRDMAIVAVAGPLANLAMLIIWAIIRFKFSSPVSSSESLQIVNVMAQYGMLVNSILMILNMLPIPPLDGSKILSSALPHKYAAMYDKLSPYGMYILLALILTHAISFILQHSTQFIDQALRILLH